MNFILYTISILLAILIILAIALPVIFIWEGGRGNSTAGPSWALISEIVLISIVIYSLLTGE